MRRAVCSLIAAGLIGVLLVSGGCGGGSSTPTAGTGGAPAGPPAPPGGAPPPPPSSSDGSGGAVPGSPTPSPAPGDNPGGQPNGTSPPPTGSPDGGVAGGYGGQPSPGGDGGPPRGFGGFGGFGGGSPEGGGPSGGLPDMSAFRLPPQKSLWDQAVDAYRSGNDVAGTQLLLTHFAIVPGAEKDLGQKMGWFTALRRPALGPRFGIAAFYDKPPRDFDSHPMPLGSSELASAISAMQQQQQQGNDDRRRNKQKKEGGEAAPVAGNPENPAPGTPQGDLFFHTGELGTKLLAALEKRIASGEYGQIYKDIAEAVARPALPSDPNNPGADPNIPGGDGGRGFGGAPGAVAGDAAAGAPANGAAPAPAQSLGLAVVWLGKVATKEEAARLAEQAHVDFLLTYEIIVRVAKSDNGNSSNFVNNTTLVRISPVKKGEPLFATKALNNLTVSNLLTNDKSKENPVEKEIARAIEALDKVCTAAPLPALTPEQVKGRLAALIAEKPANPLPVVVEARLYVAKGLLPEADLQAAAISLLGEAEYARMIIKSQGSGMGQMLGSALSLPGMVNLVRGANAVGGVAGAAARRPNPAGGAGGEGQPKGRGLRGLLPF